MSEIAINLHINNNWPMKYDLVSTEKKRKTFHTAPQSGISLVQARK